MNGTLSVADITMGRAREGPSSIPLVSRKGQLRAQQLVNVDNLLAIPESDFDNSGEPGPQAEGVNQLEIPLRQLHVPDGASSCANCLSGVVTCNLGNPGGHGIEPETFHRRGFVPGKAPR